MTLNTKNSLTDKFQKLKAEYEAEEKRLHEEGIVAEQKARLEKQRKEDRKRGRNYTRLIYNNQIKPNFDHLTSIVGENPSPTQLLYVLACLILSGKNIDAQNEFYSFLSTAQTVLNDPTIFDESQD